MSETTIAERLAGKTFVEMLREWEVIAKRAKYLLALADKAENEAMMGADAKNAEGRKAQSELAAHNERIAAHYAEIEAQAAFLMVRHQQYRESVAENRQTAAATRPGEGFGLPEGVDDPFGVGSEGVSE